MQSCLKTAVIFLTVPSAVAGRAAEGRVDSRTAATDECVLIVITNVLGMYWQVLQRSA